MAIHVAVYDVYPGDRKQLERLLEKESEIRKENGHIVNVECFGSVESMLQTPMKYDLFIVDAAEARLDPSGSINSEIASKIRQSGSTAPIVLGYRTDIVNPPVSNESNVITYTKSMTQERLSGLISIAIESKGQLPDRIEIRGGQSTVYVTPWEILYCKGDSASLDVYLTEGRTIHVLSNCTSFYSTFSDDKNFVMSGKNHIFNLNHISGIVGNKLNDRGFRMSDGTTVPINVIDFHILWKTWNDFRVKNR